MKLTKSQMRELRFYYYGTSTEPPARSDVRERLFSMGLLDILHERYGPVYVITKAGVDVVETTEGRRNA